MSAVTTASSRKPLVSHETYLLVFGTAYAGLATNLLLVITSAPLLLLLLTTDPAQSWPALVLATGLSAPGVVAAFAVFGAFSANPSAPIVRTFVRSLIRHARRALAIGLLTATAVLVLAVDIRVVWGLTVGAVAIPVLAVLLVVVALTSVVALAALPDHPEVRLRALLKASLFAALRRWYLTLAALVVLGTLLAVVAEHPALGLGLAAAPLLYVVWGGSRHALHVTLTAPGPPRPRAT
ncbi:ferredoxin-NADPH reductase [Actinotalea sp. BY-33]|uniref:Ferredoxin-NADPH reductase n=1 Tax=Actinotalea soli TaxID=2819234 RepID=A0A939LSJ3_9CELL|nr:ferredoxin-NADPH reductase [Actinotalea soli]MBO1751309.1 ferredoxin-NADPH reductase [Actinotalea soli]